MDTFLLIALSVDGQTDALWRIARFDVVQLPGKHRSISIPRLDAVRFGPARSGCLTISKV